MSPISIVPRASDGRPPIEGGAKPAETSLDLTIAAKRPFRNRRLAWVLATVSWLLLGGACDLAESRAGGGGTDVPDGFQALVLGEDGRPVAGARLHVRPGNWSLVSGVPAAGWNFVADAAGRVRVPFSDTGLWMLEISDSGNRQGLFQVVPARAAVPSGDDTLRLVPTRTLTGELPTDSGIHPLRIVLLGTDHETTPDSTGTWTVADLAPGWYRPAAVYASSPGAPVPLSPVLLAASDSTAAGTGSAGAVAGRILQVVADGAPASVKGWIVVESTSGARDTTDGAGEFSFPGLRGAPLRIVATDPVSGFSVTWDTSTARDSSTARLPARPAAPASAGRAWKELRALDANGVGRRTRVMLLADSTGYRVVANMPRPDSSSGTFGWTDDSGRFALPVDSTLPRHVTLTEPVTGNGCVFPWGGGLPGEPSGTAILGAPVATGIAIHYPVGFAVDWKGDYSVSLLGAGIAPYAVALPGGRIDASKLYPGRYRLAFFRYYDGQNGPGTVDFEVRPGTARELDTTLSQSDMEDTALWAHSVRIHVDPGSLGQVLRDVPVRIVLDSLLDWSSMGSSETGEDHRYYDESGRWIPLVRSRWSQAGRTGQTWILLDSLVPGRPRDILMRFGNAHALTSGIGGTKFVYTPRGGYLASYTNGSLDDATSNGGAKLGGDPPVGTDGYTELSSWEMTDSLALTATQPSSRLGSSYGVQVVFEVSGTASDSSTILSLGPDSGGAPRASLRLSGGALVLRTESGSASTEVPVGTGPLPRSTWMAAQLRFGGDSLSVRIASPDPNVSFSTSTPFDGAFGTDSTRLVVGSPEPGTGGFDGRVERLEFHDAGWNPSAMEFAATQWVQPPRNVSFTRLK